MIKYQLTQCSTGKLLFQEELEEPLSMCLWQKRACRKVLKFKRTPEEVRRAIKEKDVLAGWANYDFFRRIDTPVEELNACVEKLFGCYASF